MKPQCPTSAGLLPRTQARLRGTMLMAIAAVLAPACTGYLDDGLRREDGPKTDAIPPFFDEALRERPASVGVCTQDAPHPRGLLRLTGSELLNTLRAALPLPVSLDGIPISDTLRETKHAPDPSLAISRDTQAELDALASAIADVSVRKAGQVLSCPARDFGTNADCTRTMIEQWAKALFHTRVEHEDVDRLVALARDLAQRTTGEQALHTTVRALILSPRTLYLTEGFDNHDPAQPSPLSKEERAAFIAYRLTGGPPTPTLVAELAEANDLAALRRRIIEYFPNAQLQQAAARFLHSWLAIDAVTNLQRDPQKHPGFDATARARLLDESTRTIERTLSAGSATLARILTEPVASEFAGDGTGSGDPRDDGYARHGRPGLFLLPGVLAGMSSLDHTNIPRRGRFLLRRLFCDTVPTPPANLVQMQPPLTGTPSERERFQRIEQEPSCRGCHMRVDGLGFALEGYDELGRARTHDEHGNPILTEGRHTIEGHPDLVFSDARDLFTQAASHPRVESCLSVQIFRYLARRPERENADACLIGDTTATGRMHGFDVLELFVDTLVRLALAPRAP